ncbi:MAG: MMPL family transporter, partial [Minisyncoccia bacterium]
IFERMKEEIASGKKIADSIGIGFKRAWSSIRDANISSIISAIVLFWQGTALIKGFSLTFGIGIIVSMLTAVVVTRALLLSFTKKDNNKESKIIRFLYKSGLNK